MINAGSLNVHCSYNFSITPKTKKEYEKIIFNLPKLKRSKNFKDEIIEYYFMRHILRDKNWIFDNYDRMLTNIKGYHKLQS